MSILIKPERTFEGTPGDESQSFPLAHGSDLPLDLTHDQVVLLLKAAEALQAKLPGRAGRKLDLVGGKRK